MEEAVKIGMIAISGALIVFCGVYCIAKIVSSGFNAMARQPEIADKVKSSMLVPLGLIEGAVLIGAGICFYLGTK